VLSDALNLKTEQILRNHLWRHSISVDRDESTPEEVAELLEVLIDGLLEGEETALHAYAVVQEGVVDRTFFEAIEDAECPRFPLVGSYEASETGPWSNRPFVFHLTEHSLLQAFVRAYWGKGTLAVFFSTLEPVEFFDQIRRFGVVRRDGGRLLWAPFWYPRSFEKFLTDSDSARTDKVFERIAYYLAEGEEGGTVRIYCRGDDEGAS
jgi:hypothetical protein